MKHLELCVGVVSDWCWHCHATSRAFLSLCFSISCVLLRKKCKDLNVTDVEA